MVRKFGRVKSKKVAKVRSAYMWKTTEYDGGDDDDDDDDEIKGRL